MPNNVSYAPIPAQFLWTSHPTPQKPGIASKLVQTEETMRLFPCACAYFKFLPCYFSCFILIDLPFISCLLILSAHFTSKKQLLNYSPNSKRLFSEMLHCALRLLHTQTATHHGRNEFLIALQVPSMIQRRSCIGHGSNVDHNALRAWRATMCNE